MARQLNKQTFGIPSADVLANIEASDKCAQLQAASYGFQAKLADLERQFEEKTSESVRKHHAGLQSFRSMSWMEARRRKASALRLRLSKSLASLRHRPSQAKVLSTIQRLGKTTKALA
jgi:hypothetical protein